MRRLVAFMICAVSLGAAAQLPDYVPTDGLVAWFPFNGNALDESSNGHDANVVGATLSEDRFGTSESAYLFDGHDRIFPSNYEDFPLQERTTSIWVKSNVLATGGRCVFGYGGASCGDSWLLNYNNQGNLPSSGFAYEFQGHCNNQAVSAPMAPEDFISWHHIVGRTSQSGTDIFIDGILETHSDLFVSNTVPNCAVLGAQPSPSGSCEYQDSNNQLWDGLLDDFGVWNRALTDLEILGIFQAAPPVLGCTNQEACNFDLVATIDDGSCHFNCQFCHDGTVWDEDLFKCVVANPADINFDGCVQLNDLLDLLSAYGDCGAEESPWQCGDPLEYQYQGHSYQTVQIGDQCWFAENLRSANYRNGDVITPNLNDGQWNSLSTGAKTVYGEGPNCINASPIVDACDPVQSYAAYGHLYNWYAVDDARGLCPSGWSVPAIDAFHQMVDFLALDVDGNEGLVEDMLKDVIGWSSDGNGNNTSGFSAIPGGYRMPNGSYTYSGSDGSWWSASPSGSSGASLFNLSSTENDVDFHESSRRYGLSIRCIKDTE